MPIQPTLTCASPHDASLLRRQADDLLQRLVADREASEQRLAASGKRDPLKTVTGVTALERAILTTRDMIAQMDLMLAELDSGLRRESAFNGSASQPAPARTPQPMRHRGGGMLIGKRPVAATA